MIFRRALMLGLAFGFGLAQTAPAADEKAPAFTDAAQAGPDFRIQGEYQGKIGADSFAGAQVIALGDAKFDAILFAKGLPGGGADKTRVPLKGETKNGTTSFTGLTFSGAIKDGVFSGVLDNVELTLKRVDRESPTMGAKLPRGAIVLFDGTSADQWVDGKIEEGDLLGAGARTK